jgi:hypothetical protein
LKLDLTAVGQRELARLELDDAQSTPNIAKQRSAPCLMAPP